MVEERSLDRAADRAQLADVENRLPLGEQLRRHRIEPSADGAGEQQRRCRREVMTSTEVLGEVRRTLIFVGLLRTQTNAVDLGADAKGTVVRERTEAAHLRRYDTSPRLEVTVLQPLWQACGIVTYVVVVGRIPTDSSALVRQGTEELFYLTVLLSIVVSSFSDSIIVANSSSKHGLKRLLEEFAVRYIRHCAAGLHRLVPTVFNAEENNARRVAPAIDHLRRSSVCISHRRKRIAGFRA